MGCGTLILREFVLCPREGFVELRPTFGPSQGRGGCSRRDTRVSGRPPHTGRPSTSGIASGRGRGTRQRPLEPSWHPRLRHSGARRSPAPARDPAPAPIAPRKGTGPGTIDPLRSTRGPPPAAFLTTRHPGIGRSQGRW